MFKSIKYYFLYFADYIFSEILLKIRKDDYMLDEEKYQHVRKCAHYAYPGEELDYNTCITMQELLNTMYCRLGKIYILTGEDWYFILIREMSHIVAYDFASASGKCKDIVKVYGILIKLFKGKNVFLLCRESTSYPLVKLLEKRRDYKILKDELVFRDNERYHRVFIKVR